MLEFRQPVCVGTLLAIWNVGCCDDGKLVIVLFVGIDVGDTDGVPLGDRLGLKEGSRDGTEEGRLEGNLEGRLLGVIGDFVGWTQLLHRLPSGQN